MWLACTPYCVKAQHPNLIWRVSDYRNTKHRKKFAFSIEYRDFYAKFENRKLEFREFLAIFIKYRIVFFITRPKYVTQNFRAEPFCIWSVGSFKFFWSKITIFAGFKRFLLKLDFRMLSRQVWALWSRKRSKLPFSIEISIFREKIFRNSGGWNES